MQQSGAVDVAIETALERLVEIDPPEPVSWMPQTVGWIVLGILVVGVLGVATSRAIRRWRRNAYRRAALGELSALEESLDSQGSAALIGLGELLRRTVLAVAERERVAGLSAAEWTRLLDGSLSEPVFLESGTDLLSQLTYGRAAAVVPEEAVALLRASRHWIEHHDRSRLVGAGRT